MSLNSLSIDELRALPHGANDAFSVEISPNDQLEIKRVLRILPSKRLVADALLNGDRVLAKLFFSSGMSNALENEILGYQLLQQSQLLTPQLQARLHSEDGKIEVVCYQFIDGAESFLQLYERVDISQKQGLLIKLFKLIESMYSKGVFQQDIHLDNFLCRQVGQELEITVIDPGSVFELSEKIQKEKNIALLVAQFNLLEQSEILQLIKKEALFSDVVLSTDLVLQTWQARADGFLKKILRECTYTVDASTAGFNVFIRRDYFSDQLSELINSIKTAKKIPAENLIKIIKPGNSSVVSLVICGDKKLVIKHCRNKSISRKIRRLFKKSRGRGSWCFSHLFQFAGLTVPEPVALLEARLGFFTTESWFISEFVEGEDLLSVWQRDEAQAILIAQLVNIFRVLKMLKLSHGDFKATNLMLKEKDIFLIDYDGIKQHSSTVKLEQALEKDKNRLLKNWDNSLLVQRLDAAISEVLCD